MRYTDAPHWVIACVTSMVGYVVVMAGFLASAAQDGGGLQPLNAAVAWIVGLLLGLPTLILAGLLFVRRVAGLAAMASVGWTIVSGALWLPIEPKLGGVAITVGLVLIACVIIDRRA